MTIYHVGSSELSPQRSEAPRLERPARAMASIREPPLEQSLAEMFTMLDIYIYTYAYMYMYIYIY